MKRKTCKNCKYYTGVECHGHGDFWGSCKLLLKIYNQLEKTYDDWLDCDLDITKAICYDDTICIFYLFLKDESYGGKFVYVKEDSNNN